MTNDKKLETAIAQAQKRGWMSEPTYQYAYKSDQEHLQLSFSKNSSPNYAEVFVLSLNDILFGTDFCEKFFGDFIMGDCICGLFCIYDQTFANTHRVRMLSMSESERIDFLYKHVEGEEDLKCECAKMSCPPSCEGIHTHKTFFCGKCKVEDNPAVVSVGGDLKKELDDSQSKNTSRYCIAHERKYNKTHTFRECMLQLNSVCDSEGNILTEANIESALHAQPVELKKIDRLEIAPYTNRGDGEMLTYQKVNELISEHNTLVDYVQKLNKECRVNMN